MAKKSKKYKWHNGILDFAEVYSGNIRVGSGYVFFYNNKMRAVYTDSNGVDLPPAMYTIILVSKGKLIVVSETIQ